MISQCIGSAANLQEQQRTSAANTTQRKQRWQRSPRSGKDAGQLCAHGLRPDAREGGRRGAEDHAQNLAVRRTVHHALHACAEPYIEQQQHISEKRTAAPRSQHCECNTAAEDANKQTDQCEFACVVLFPGGKHERRNGHAPRHEQRQAVSGLHRRTLDLHAGTHAGRQQRLSKRAGAESQHQQ